jgi:hypothetical protein
MRAPHDGRPAYFPHGVNRDTGAVVTALSLLGQMVEDFGRFEGDFSVSSSARSVQNFALTYGLACHTHEVVEQGLPIFATESVACVPLIRNVFEAGVTAQWLLGVDNAGITLVQEHARQRRALRRNLSESPDLNLQSMATRVHLEDESVDFSNTLPYRPTFEAICRAFVEGNDLYAYYRLLCGHTHAGVEVADEWLDLDEQHPSGLALRRAPRTLWSDSWLYLALLGLGWSSRALDRVVLGEPRRAFLDRVEQEAHVRFQLQPHS